MHDCYLVVIISVIITYYQGTKQLRVWMRSHEELSFILFLHSHHISSFLLDLEASCSFLLCCLVFRTKKEGRRVQNLSVSIYQLMQNHKEKHRCFKDPSVWSQESRAEERLFIITADSRSLRMSHSASLSLLERSEVSTSLLSPAASSAGGRER